jgi:hypothetical protein
LPSSRNFVLGTLRAQTRLTVRHTKSRQRCEAIVDGEAQRAAAPLLGLSPASVYQA